MWPLSAITFGSLTGWLSPWNWASKLQGFAATNYLRAPAASVSLCNATPDGFSACLVHVAQQFSIARGHFIKSSNSGASLFKLKTNHFLHLQEPRNLENSARTTGWVCNRELQCSAMLWTSKPPEVAAMEGCSPQKGETNQLKGGRRHCRMRDSKNELYYPHVKLKACRRGCSLLTQLTAHKALYPYIYPVNMSELSMHVLRKLLPTSLPRAASKVTTLWNCSSACPTNWRNEKRSAQKNDILEASRTSI